MYTLAVQRDFVAQHFLIGGNWGAENQWHSHHYRLELQLQGDALDRHGFLVDIVDVEAALEEAVAIYRDKTLNDLPDFERQNPSIEHFSRILCHWFARRIVASSLTSMTVRLWENQIAWTSFRVDLPLDSAA